MARHKRRNPRSAFHHTISRALRFEPLEDRRLLAAVTVSNTLDSVNGDTSSIPNLIANDGGDGISLREAISAANQFADLDEITFDPLVFSEPQIISIGSQLPTIENSLTITGTGAGLVTITAGNGDDNTFNTGDGYRIFNIDDGDDETVLDVQLTQLTLNSGDVEGDGGAIRSWEKLTISDSLITGNSASGSGGGIYALDLTIVDSTISGNTAAKEGGGVSGAYYYNNQDCTLTVSNSTLTDNSAGQRGGGIFLIGETTITESELSNNSAVQEGGGIWGGPLTIADSTISGNIAVGNGGGIHSFYSTTISGSTITNNSGGFGGGLYAVSTTTVTECTISGNTAGDGGGIFANGGDLSVSLSTISDNSVGGAGGGISFRGFSNIELSISNSTVTGNSADRGGGIFSYNSKSIVNSTISNNTARRGGGLWVYDGTVVSGSTITGNVADGSGGGIYSLRGSLAVEDSVISYNSVLNGNGGGVYTSAREEEFIFSRSTISGNSALDGGGIFAQVEPGLGNSFISHLKLNGSTISGNTAETGFGGGLAPYYGLHVVVEHSTITGNTAPAGQGSGIGLRHSSFFGPIGVSSSIIAGNTNSDLDVTAVNTFQSNGYNLIGTGNAVSAFTNNDQTGIVDPVLSPLADNGGPTSTHAVLFGSPALDAGDPAATAGENDIPLYDQRGMPFDRIVDGDGDGSNGHRIDIGAYEAQGIPNARPVITSPSTANVPENDSDVLTVTASDADLPAQVVTFSIVGGADQSQFSISSSGELAFIAPPDFETPTDNDGDNIYQVTVRADDGEGGIVIQSLSVTVTPVNDNSPVFTSPDFISLPENTTDVLTVTASDADLPAPALSYSIVGGADQALFTITSDGELSFVSPPDYESPGDSNGDNVYVAIVQASDGSRTAIQALLVTVTDVSEPLGDYNGNGVVDTADYTVWRDTLGANLTPFSGTDGSGNGVIDQDDRIVWRANFGNTLGSGSAALAGGSQPPESIGGSVAASVEFVATDGGERGAPAIERGTDALVRPSGSDSQARMLALLDLLDSLPSPTGEAEFGAWDFTEESSESEERDAAAWEEAIGAGAALDWP